MAQPVVAKPGTPAPAAAPVAEPAPTVQAVAEPAPAVATPVPAPEPVAQPAISNDRTREEFEKLLENNRTLHQANQLLTQEVLHRTQINQQFAPVQTNGYVQPTPAVQDFVEFDPETGQKYINEQKLSQSLTEAQTRALRAEQTVQNYIKASEDRELNRQNSEAFAIYPDLNPTNPSFNPGFSNQTSALLLHSMMNPRNYGGKPLTFVEAANQVKAGFGIQTTQAPQTPASVETPAPVANGQSTQDLRADASVDLRSQPQQSFAPQVDANIAALQARTRMGDDSALAERLKYTEHIVPKEGTS